MTLEEYQSDWNASGPGQRLQDELDRLMQSLRRSERRRRIVLGLCAFNTAAAVLVALSFLLSGRPIAWNEAGPVLALQVLLAFALAALVRRHGRRRRELEARGMSVVDAAQAGLNNVASEIRDIRVMALAAAVTIPVLGFVVSQLIESGKMNGQAAWGFGLVCSVIIGANAAYQTLRYRRTLAPRRARLEQVLSRLSAQA